MENNDLVEVKAKKYNRKMVLGQKKELIEFIDAEIVRVRQSAQKADEASKFITTGPSQSGDKYHSENSAHLTKEYLARIMNLKKEIEDANEQASSSARPVCLVEVEYEDASRLSFFLVKNAVSLTGHLFISVGSPLGNSVFGKKPGDTFSYFPESSDTSRKYSAKIVRIE